MKKLVELRREVLKNPFLWVNTVRPVASFAGARRVKGRWIPDWTTARHRRQVKKAVKSFFEDHRTMHLRMRGKSRK